MGERQGTHPDQHRPVGKPARPTRDCHQAGAWRFGHQPAAAIVVVGWARLLPEFLHLFVWLLLSVLLVDVADLLADCLCMMRLHPSSLLTLQLLSVLRAHARRDFIVVSLAL